MPEVNQIGPNSDWEALRESSKPRPDTFDSDIQAYHEADAAVYAVEYGTDADGSSMAEAITAIVPLSSVNNDPIMRVYECDGWYFAVVL